MFKAVLLFLAVAFIASIPFLSNWISIRSGDQILKMKSSDEVIGSFIDRHPERILSSLERYQVSKEKTRVADIYDRMAELASSEYPTIGNPDSQVSVVEFFDYSCGYCKLMAKTTEKLLQKYDIKYVFRDFPIREGSALPSKYGMAVYMMDKSKFKDFFFKAIEEKKYTEESLNKIVQDIGLDKEKFLLFFRKKSASIDLLIERTKSDARSLRIGGTPAFIIGDMLSVGATDLQDMSALIEDFKKRRDIK